PNDIDGLGHGTDKAAQRSAGGEVRTLPRYRGRIVGKRPALDMGFFDRVVVPIYRVAIPRSTASLRRASATSPRTKLHASARRATARSVICSPPPAIITGGRGFWTGFGSRIASSTSKYRPWKVVRGSVHIFKINSIASSICRIRVAGRGGDSQP